MADEDLTLPGRPGPALQAAWDGLGPHEKAALLPHLLGGTSAEWIALVLTEEGHRIGATSIKNYRRALRETGVQV